MTEVKKVQGKAEKDRVINPECSEFKMPVTEWELEKYLDI